MTDVVRTIACAVALAVAACGGGGADADGGADAGRPPQLSIVSPGDSIGLRPAETAELRVRYVTADGTSIVGVPVAFTLVAGDGGAGGSTLSAATVATDGTGEAAVTFLAGASGFDLQVHADAPGARATFYISVSAGGFAALEVTPAYAGARPAEELDRIELRLYRGTSVACAELDVDAPVDSPLAPRTLTAWGEPATWATINADEGYTLLVWAVHAVSGGAVSATCLDVPASAIPPSPVSLAVTVPDRPLAVAAQPLATVLELAPLDAALAARGAHRPWRTLACPLGGAQLLLDWLVDALSGDGALDGVTAQPSGVGAQLHALRGDVGPGGCRAATRGTGPSLEATLDAALTGPGFPRDAELATLLAQREALFGGVRLGSTVAPLGPTLVAHTLATAGLDVPGAPEVTLAETDRPVLEATATTGAPRPGDVAIGDHGFTLRAGALLAAAFDAVALAPLGLDGAAAALGTALVATAEDGGEVGCAAVSQVACGAAGQPATCAVAACGAATFALDGAMAAWWKQVDGTGLDLVWSGVATLTDGDGDLVADAIPAGAWTGQLVLADGTEVGVTGTFAAPVP